MMKYSRAIRRKLNTSPGLCKGGGLLKDLNSNALLSQTKRSGYAADSPASDQDVHWFSLNPRGGR